MKHRTAEIERCTKEVKEIREAIDEIAMVEIRNLAINHGLAGSEDECDSDSDVEEADPEGILTDELKVMLIELLRESKYNWFEFICRIESDSKENLHKQCQRFYIDLPKYGLSNEEVELAQQSYTAFKCDEEQHSYSRKKIAQMLNGDIVTDSESDDPDLYHNNKELAKVESLKRSASRRKAKRIAGRKFLKRSYSKRANSILEKYPDIGQSIEEYVQSCNLGADMWRRTGVLTFDGNTRVKKEATYRRIKKSDMEEHFPMVQLLSYA